MTDFGISAIISIVNHCREACLAAKQYPTETARIYCRLSCLLVRIPDWEKSLGDNDPKRYLFVQNLYHALSMLSLCVEGLETRDQHKWRRKLTFLFQGKDMLDELLSAENALNSALLDINIDNSFAATRMPELNDTCQTLQKIEHDMASMMVMICKQVGESPIGGDTVSNETFDDRINAVLVKCYEDDDDVSSSVVGTDITCSSGTLVSEEVIDDKSSLLINDRSQVMFTDNRIGTGGFAKVFKGKYREEDVAIKVIDIYRDYDNILQMSDEIYRAECELVSDEAYIMKQCSVHPKIVDVFGYCDPIKKGSEPFIVMELMHCSLRWILHGENDMNLSFCTRLNLMKDVASAIEFLHLQRYVHQDIKPSNILVNEACTVAKLTDFGVTVQKSYYTTWAQRHHTVLNTVLGRSVKKAAGTLAYQAPELVLKQVNETSRTAEMYSFGVTVWECVTGVIPHTGEEDRIIERAKDPEKQMLQFPLRLFLRDANLSSDEQKAFSILEKIAYVCLQKQPQNRPNATQVTQYFNGTRTCPNDVFSSLSHWVNSNMEKMRENDVVSYPKPVKSHQSSSKRQFPNQSFSSLSEWDNNSNLEMMSENGVVTYPKTEKNQQSNSPFGSVRSLIRKNRGLIIFLCSALIAISLTILIVRRKKSYLQVLPENQCFEGTDVLRNSIIKYMNGDTSVRERYGSLIGDWCVSRIEDFSSLFNSSIYSFDKFNEDISRWNVSSAKNMASMFKDAVSFNGNLSTWDVSSVTDMQYMFSNASTFTSSLSEWDVSKVTNMNYMFAYAQSFDGDISKWDVASVKSMRAMFFGAHEFNQDLRLWDVSRVVDMPFMFMYAYKFNGNVSSWNVSSVTDIGFLFYNVSRFNHDLSRWDLSSAWGMQSMFERASAFTGNISSWNVSSVNNTSHMFAGASSFNSDLSSWDVSSVNWMNHMFQGAVSFDSDLSSWDVSSVTYMNHMFQDAPLFDSDLSLWDISSVVNMSHMFVRASSFNQTLCSWRKQIKIAPPADVTNMFDLSGCSDTSSPDLNNLSAGPFCEQCY